MSFCTLLWHFYSEIIMIIIVIAYYFGLQLCFMLVTSNDIYSIIDGPYLPDYCKMFYYLTLDIKSKHFINDNNYKRLAIISRIVQLLMLNYLLPTLSGLSILTNIIIKSFY